MNQLKDAMLGAGLAQTSTGTLTFEQMTGRDVEYMLDCIFATWTGGDSADTIRRPLWAIRYTKEEAAFIKEAQRMARLGFRRFVARAQRLLLEDTAHLDEIYDQLEGFPSSPVTDGFRELLDMLQHKLAAQESRRAAGKRPPFHHTTVQGFIEALITWGQVSRMGRIHPSWHAS